jgi:transmembrane sensor
MRDVESQKAGLAEHVEPALDEARLARQLGAILPRLATRRVRRPWTHFAVPALSFAIVVLAWLLVRTPSVSTTPALATGAVIHAGAAPGDSITLGDGTHLVLDATSELKLAELEPQRVRLELARGGVELDVVHVENRSFVVAAAGYDVTVVGTQFDVRFGEGTPRSVQVHVKRGRVRVTRVATGDTHMLGAGESWSADLPGGTGALPTSSTSAVASAAPEELPEAPEPVATVAPGTTAPRAARTATPSARALPSDESPKELLVRAQAARAAGDPKEAARLLDAIRTHHRDDARAGLAAFELGRVRLDALKDPAGAVEAFEDAIRLSPTAPFREDAEARRIQALDTSGNVTRCREMKRAYAEHYPTGLHRADVERRCPGP